MITRYVEDNEQLDRNIRQFERFFRVDKLTKTQLALFIQLVQSLYQEGYDDGFDFNSEE